MRTTTIHQAIKAEVCPESGLRDPQRRTGALYSAAVILRMEMRLFKD